jgi:hypothetical protein
LGIALAVLGSGCDWVRWGYDLGGARFNPTDGSINRLNVATMTTAWVGSAGGAIGTSSPVTWGGRVYVGASNGVVYGFDESGVAGCTAGTPTSCTPTWTSAPEGQPIDSTPIVAGDGTLFVGGGNDVLYAYDSAGVSGCSGAPAVCQPLWTASGSGGGDMSAAITVSGMVFVHDAANLYAFDAAGQTNCSGSPKVCQPLWSATGVGNTAPLPVAWNANIVYIAGGAGLAAFDATGQTSCGGSPKVCHPLWTGPSGAGQFGVVVIGPRVYAASDAVYAYDASGNVGCSGSPTVCQPLWRGTTGIPSHVYSPVAVANNVLYVEGPSDLVALDTTGTTNCSGTSPVVCQPLWSGAIGAAASSTNENSAPAVGGSVVYIGSENHDVYGFDAQGHFGCASGACRPIWRGLTGDLVRSSPAVANGYIFVGSNDGKLYAYGNAAALVNVFGNPLSNLTTSPSALSPTFSPSTHDYVVPCQSGLNAITVLVTAASGTITLNGSSGSTLQASVSLVENQAIIVTAPDPSNPALQTQYWIRCLPHDFPKIQVSKPGSPSPGYYLYGNVTKLAGTSGFYNMILDGNGTPVWFQKQSFGPLGLQLLPNDTLVWGLGQQSPLFFLQLDTEAQQLLNAPIGPTDVHEYLQEPNGNRVVLAVPVKTGVDLTALGKSANSSILDCMIEEIDPAGNLVWSWKASDHIAAAETQPTLLDTVTLNGQTVYGPYHCNSIDVDASGTHVLLSARADSAVYNIDKATGTVLWKLGGSGTNPDNAQLLTIQNDPDVTISGQHDARYQPNGDIALFDDRTALAGAARGVEYAIDTTAGTATLDWEYGNPDGFGSLATGSFRRYPDGSSLVGWGFHTGSGFTEVDASGNVLFQVTFPNNEYGYRSIKIPTSAMNLTILRETVGMVGTAPS